MDTNETRIYMAILTGAFVLVVLIIIFVIHIIRYQRRKVAVHFESIKEQFNYLDNERERIAQDLHADLGGSLSAIKMRLQRLKNLDPENAAVIKFSQLHLDKTIQRLRDISFNLVSGVLLREGLDEALKDVIDIMTYATSVKVNYQYNLPCLDKDRSLHIYKIAQEILNNIIKHADATIVIFDIGIFKNIIRLHITDNGNGFNKYKIKKENKGAGMKNIRARADLLKAKIYLTTEEQKGVDYIIEIPV